MVPVMGLVQQLLLLIVRKRGMCDIPQSIPKSRVLLGELFQLQIRFLLKTLRKGYRELSIIQQDDTFKL